MTYGQVVDYIVKLFGYANLTLTPNGNTGANVIALGQSAGIGNPLSNMFIIANTELTSYANWAAADATISPTGIAGNTYCYYDQTTKSIGAVRL